MNSSTSKMNEKQDVIGDQTGWGNDFSGEKITGGQDVLMNVAQFVSWFLSGAG